MRSPFSCFRNWSPPRGAIKPTPVFAARTSRPAGRSAQVFPLQGDQVGRAALACRNISIESVAFHSDVAMGLDSQFIICLSRRRGDAVRLTCTVRRCEQAPVPIGPTAYLIAATFEQVLEPSTNGMAQRELLSVSTTAK